LILMKKKTSKKKKIKGKKASKKKAPEKTVKKKEPVKQEREFIELDIPEKVSPEPAPVEMPEKKQGGLKNVLIAVVVIAVLAVAYYIFVLPRGQFVRGSVVDEQTFLNNFQDAENIYIVTDIRGVQEQQARRNIMQCSTDFAFSPIMGSKKVTLISLGDQGCIYASNGSADTKTYDECFAMLPDGFTIYVEEGSEYQFYSNGVVVGINETYTDGTCGIHMV
jgi:hypothetical protein